MLKSRFGKNAVAILLIVSVVGTSVFAGGGAAGNRRRARGILQTLPADTLFCVRVNNLDTTTQALEAFVQGVGKNDPKIKEDVLAKMGKLLGQDKPLAVRLRGGFALFGLTVPESQPSMNPFGSVFVGALIPVINYDNFVKRNANVQEPDDNGISAIGEGQRVEAIVTKVGQFALITHGSDKARLAKAKELLTAQGGKLGAAMAPEERQMSQQPAWAYANVAKVWSMFGPMVTSMTQQMKTGMEMGMKQAGGPVTNPEAILKFYLTILKTMVEGTDHVSVALKPSAEAIRVTFRSQAVDGSFVDDLLVSPPDSQWWDLLGHIDEGAMVNVAGSIGKDSLRKMYSGLFDLIGSLGDNGLSEDDMNGVRALTTKAINAMGDSLAVSISTGNEKGEFFKGKYIIKVNDENAFSQVIEDELGMMNKGIFTKFYKCLGMDLKINSTVSKRQYKGVQIGQAKVSFDIGGEGMEQAREALKKIWGDGLRYDWAVVNGYCVIGIGAGGGRVVEKTVDQIRSNEMLEPNDEINQAIATFGQPEPSDYDFGGTVNVVRLLNMVSNMAAVGSDGKITPLNAASHSNVVFAGKVGDGRMLVETVVPKEHVMEVKAAAKQFGKIMKQKAAEQQAQMKAGQGKEKKEDADNDDKGEHEDKDNR